MAHKKRKILIVALAQSTHTHAWIDLISREKFDVRLFGIKNSRPLVQFNTFYYCLEKNYPFINKLPSRNSWLKALRKLLFFIDYFKGNFFEKRWLRRVIENWQPDVIHTLGIDPAALYFLDVHHYLKKAKKDKYRWVVTIRGGSDMELERFNPEKKKIFKKIFQECDLAIADNKITYSYAFDLGLKKDKKPILEFIPGTGGMDVEKLSHLRKQKTAQSRIVLWPKACEAAYSKGLPVLEAIKIAWPKITPCRFIMTACDHDFLKWLDASDPEIRKNIETYGRIPRVDLLKIMAKARVVLLPSLVDGVPNSLYEAMACKTLPIVSPLETIKTIVGKNNVLFARNLYPNEIADALVKAMNNNYLLEEMIEENFTLVKKIANRERIAPVVNNFYEKLSKR